MNVEARAEVPSRVVVVPVPAGVEPNPDYLVRLRSVGGAWHDVFLYPVLVVKEFHNNDRGMTIMSCRARRSACSTFKESSTSKPPPA